MLSNTLIIYVMGATQGKATSGLTWNAIMIGWVLPFIIGDLIKAFLAALIATKADLSRYLK